MLNDRAKDRDRPCVRDRLRPRLPRPGLMIALLTAAGLVLIEMYRLTLTGGARVDLPGAGDESADGSEGGALPAVDLPVQKEPPDTPRRVYGQLRRVLRIATDAVLVSALIFAVFVAYGLVNNRWYHVLVVEGGSMYPTITAGDLIVITRPPSQIEPGMILTLEVDHSVVTHRVERVNPDGTFVTKGDANSAGDDFTGNDVHIIGQYLFRIPALGGLLPVGAGPAPHSSGAWFADGSSVGVSAFAAQWSEQAP